MIDKTFGYSAAGNIDQINNTATPMNFTYNSLGGGYLNQYTYDGLNRLTAATGNWTGSTGPETYSINMAYDKMGGITWKNQSASLSYPGYPGQKYNYYYTHGNTAHPHATSKIWDRRNHTQYTYGFDANGNPTTTHEQYAPPKQGKANPSGPITLLQENYWDERNQLRGLWNTSGLNHYIYDADGQRLMKSTLPMAHSSVDAQQLQATNSFPSAQYTVYVNAGLVYESDGGPATYTKHYYAGPLRVASHIGSGNPNQETHPTSGGNLAQGGPAGSTGSSNGLAVLGDLNGLLAHYGMSVPPTAPPTDTIAMQVLNDPGECDAYYGADVIEKNRCLCDHFPDVALQQGIDCSPYTPIYWYHPDYIGNVEFVSDRTGQPYQHFYYAPFGDPMVSQHVGTGSFNSAFRFNAKEYDEETGNYYYGARYYDPKVSLWMGVDPLAHLRTWVSPYNFVQNNPISRIDPDGRLDTKYVDEMGKEIANTDDGSDDVVVVKNEDRNLFDFALNGTTKENQNSPDWNKRWSNYLNRNQDLSSLTAPWMDVASKELGQTEIPGAEHNPRIVEYLKTTGSWWNSDETPWCAGYCNWVMQESGLEGRNSAKAYDWKTWGKQVYSPALGAVAIMNYSHVGFVAGFNSDGRVILLGGNQGKPGSVNLSPNSPSSVIQYRLPSSATPIFNLPKYNLKGRSLDYNSSH